MAAEHVFLDTSLLVAASVEEHPKYAASKTYVEGLAVERTPTCITPQICREFMAVLTRAAIGPRSFSVEEALTGDYFDYFDFFNEERPHQPLGYTCRQPSISRRYRSPSRSLRDMHRD